MAFSALAGLFATRVAAGAIDITDDKQVPPVIKADVQNAVEELSQQSQTKIATDPGIAVKAAPVDPGVAVKVAVDTDRSATR